MGPLRVVRQSGGEVHEAAAFRINRTAGFDKTRDRRSHGTIARKLLSVKLWITAAKIDALSSFRKSAVQDWAEGGDFCSRAFQDSEIVGIIKTKCPVVGDRNRHLAMRRFFRRCHRHDNLGARASE